MGWCCDGTGLEANVKAAIRKYKKQFGRRPGGIHARPQPDLPKEIDGIPVVADTTVPPHHLFLTHMERSEMQNATPQELCDAYRAELERLYGKEIAEKSRAVYGRGWYYICVASRYDDGSVGLGGRQPRAYRKEQVIEMIDNLRKRRPE